jgi:DNA-binding MarR family transcriptional regulator
MTAPLVTSPGTEPVVDDAEELASRLRLSINRLHRMLRQESLAGLSPAQASALGAVNRLGSPTLGELAAVEQVQPPTMTKIVATLADAGMVTRVTDASDRRSARVRITPAGKRSLERIRTLKNAFLTRRLAELSPDERAGAADLVGLLEHLVGR